MMTSIAVGSVAFVAVAGSVSAVAETAVPGDVLYTVKTNINESIRSNIAMSTSAEAEVEADLAIRRLEETEELARDGELNAQMRTQLQERFELHSNNALTLAQEAEASGNADAAAEVRADFYQRLQEHQETLQQLQQSGTADAQLSIILAVVNATALEVSTDGDVQAESSSETEESTRMQVEAEAAIQSAQELMTSMQTTLDSAAQLSADIRAEAEADLQSALDSLQEAQQQLRVEAYTRARALAEDARNTINSVGANIYAETEGMIDL